MICVYLFVATIHIIPAPCGERLKISGNRRVCRENFRFTSESLYNKWHIIAQNHSLTREPEVFAEKLFMRCAVVEGRHTIFDMNDAFVTCAFSIT